MHHKKHKNLFVIDNKTGLASFPILEQKYKIKNLVTYDNQKWGNMNNKFACTTNNIENIQNREFKITQIVRAKTVFNMTTPPEDTILHMNNQTYNYLKYTNKPNPNGYKYILVRTNAIVYEQQKYPTEFVTEPSDRAIIVLVNPSWNGIVIMHIGMPHNYFKGYISKR